VTAGPGDGTAAGCEQAIGILKAAFVQGMLTKDEFDQRVGQAFAARTQAELAALGADIPVMPTASAEPAVAQPPAPVRAWDGSLVPRPGRLLAVTTALYATVWAFAILPSWPEDVEGDPPKAVVLLLFSATLVYLSFLVVGVVFMIDGWQERRAAAAAARAGRDLITGTPGCPAGPRS